MANILEKYGVKEVADVTFYEINGDGSKGAPVLYLDTLKVSTIEQTAEQSDAKGGKGNSTLLIWDYGKEISVTLEDALFSQKSMAVMFGNGTVTELSGTTITKTLQFVCTTADTVATSWTDVNGVSRTIPTYALGGRAYGADGSDLGDYDDVGFTMTVGTPYFMKFDVTIDTGSEIEISSNSFPGTYYVEGETYARSEITGADSYFKFEIPKAKMQSENTITMEAEGDPSVFNMSLRVLRPADHKMMKLTQYTLPTV